MIDVTVSTTIGRPVDEVFNFVADMTNEPRWHTDIVDATQVTEGDVALGTRYRVRFRSSMGPPEGIVEVAEFDPLRRFASRSDLGNMAPTVSHDFEPVDGGTHVTRRVRIEMSGAMRLTAPLMRMMVRRRNLRFIDNLKRELEA
jgi:uncharacterized protein YndB with AHSA1/START domain